MENPKLSHAAFAERLRECIAKVGSAGRLGEVAKVHRNTIQGYLKKFEPDRATLISLAQASGVAPEWLATGYTAPDPISDQPTAPSPKQEARLLYIHKRLAKLVENEGGADAFRETTGLPDERLKQLLAGAEMTAAEVSQICSTTQTPPGWFLWAKGFDQTDYNHVTKLVQQLVSDLELVEENRAGFIKMPSVGAWRDGDITSVFHLFRTIFERLLPGQYHIREIKDNAMSPTLEPNDIVVVQGEGAATVPGIYMFKRDGGAEFFARGISGSDLMTFSFDNDRFREATAHRLLSPDAETECVGRVVAVFGPPY